MITFALDSSGKTASICVLQGQNVLYQKLIDEGLTHSQTLLPLVQQGFAACSLAAEDISLYAVTAGPGSFTGLRIGMALVKGLALPAQTPVAPVSTLEATAVATGVAGSVVAALNARRGEVYWAAFRCDDGVYTRSTPDAAMPAEMLFPALQALPSPICFVGDGADICYTIYKERLPVQVIPQPCVALGAAQVAQNMWQAGLSVPAAMAWPQYLRLSQAERERAERLAREEEGNA